MIDQETLNVFNQLYEDTYQDILNYVIVHCSYVEDVKDIVQEIYLDVLKRLECHKDLSGPYIMGITKHKVKDYYRFKYKHAWISLFSNIRQQENMAFIDTVSAEIDIEKMLLKEEDIQFVWQYLKKQDVVIFKIFYLYYDREWSIKEIARELHLSESNVKNHLYRTLHKLKTLMRDRGEENERKANDKNHV